MWNPLHVFVFQDWHIPVLFFLVPHFHVCCWPCTCGFEFDYHCSLRHHGSLVCRAASVESSFSQPQFRVLLRFDLMAVVSHYSCDFPRFNYFSNRLAKFSNQIANRIALFHIFISQVVLPKWFKSQFKSQWRLRFPDHW